MVSTPFCVRLSNVTYVGIGVSPPVLRTKNSSVSSVVESLIVRRLPLFPFRDKRLAIELRSAQVHICDAAAVADVVERIRVQDDEVGAFAGCERSHVVQAQQIGRPRRGGDARL